MKIFDLLQEIEEILDSAGGFPLTGKVIVDPEDISDILNEIRNELPEEINKAQWITNQQERILNDAQEEYTKMLNLAAEKADQMVENDDITLRAKKRADDIMRETEKSIVSFKQGSFDYVEDLFVSFQKKLNELNASYVQKMHEEMSTTFQTMDVIIEQNKAEIAELREKLNNEASFEAQSTADLPENEESADRA